MTTRRLNRIFAPDGRTVIIALDHGLIDGPCEGFEDPAATIASVDIVTPASTCTSKS